MRGFAAHKPDVHVCAHSKPRRSGSRPAQHQCHLPQQLTNLRQFRPQHSKQPARCRRLSSGCKVFALDAAMPFDFETKATARLRAQTSMRIGIVGFGTFGQFLAKRLVQQGHKVIATSRGDYSSLAQSLGVHFFQDADDFAEEHPEVVILASSILSTEAVLDSLPVQRLKRSTLFVDVLSVKEFPKQLFLSKLPAQMDILCTHPMFGPDSGSGSWHGLNFMFEKVRVGSGGNRQKRVDAFLQFFEKEGCKMVAMSCEEHDRQAASTQFITHTVGRVLGAMQLQATPIDTRGFKSLLDLVDNTTHDSFDLYYGLFMYNQNATEELERLGYAFDAVKKQLLGRLHELARKQIGFTSGRPASPLLSSNGARSSASAGPSTHTGIPEIAEAVAATFVDQHDGNAVR
ncbi:hypothetical protein ABBQ32_011749 [Trebouxia sp. C0010 RCD-2024]